MERAPIISVIGTSTASPLIYELAREAGRLLARAGCIVVCGGRGGVMEGVCRGVSEEGGSFSRTSPGGDPGGEPLCHHPSRKPVSARCGISPWPRPGKL
ncbi:hypothetical protein [Aminivibrio sp.]|uniref:SLOG cluster 4 domain-containing protein n=1 Tax=Aminivibrio sp. TaxID=1872489 RepID=UPI003D96AA6D